MLKGATPIVVCKAPLGESSLRIISTWFTVRSPKNFSAIAEATLATATAPGRLSRLTRPTVTCPVKFSLSFSTVKGRAAAATADCNAGNSSRGP